MERHRAAVRTNITPRYILIVVSQQQYHTITAVCRSPGGLCDCCHSFPVPPHHRAFLRSQRDCLLLISVPLPNLGMYVLLQSVRMKLQLPLLVSRGAEKVWRCTTKMKMLAFSTVNRQTEALQSSVTARLSTSWTVSPPSIAVTGPPSSSEQLRCAREANLHSPGAVIGWVVWGTSTERSDSHPRNPSLKTPRGSSRMTPGRYQAPGGS